MQRDTQYLLLFVKMHDLRGRALHATFALPCFAARRLLGCVLTLFSHFCLFVETNMLVSCRG